MEIDGGLGEGGGQVLRTALSVACVLGKKVRIYNIRAGRENPGLRAQHLTSCKLLAQITNAKLHGAEIGSKEIIFEPGEISGGNFSFDIGTAGSCTLLLQAALPVMLSAKKECALEITGGTHVRGAPTFEYFSEVFLPAAREFGANAEAKLERAGFYPKGGGKITVDTAPSKLSGCEFAPEKHNEARYSIISSLLPSHVAEREEERIAKALHDSDISAGGEKKSVIASCAGNALAIWSGRIGVSAVGEAGKPAEKVAGDAAEAFVAELRGGKASGAEAGTAAGAGTRTSVDSHLADQLLVYAALSRGKTSFSTSKFTGHLATNAEVLRQMSERNIMLIGEGKVEVL